MTFVDGLSYLSDSFLSILPAGSIDYNVLTNQYYIEYNAKTGDIFGVFYGEDSFSYAQAAAKRGEDPEKKNVWKTDGGVLIGYFGGALGSGLKAERSKTPDFTLVNDEELYARFSNTQSDMTYTLTVTDASDEKAEPLYFRFSKTGGAFALNYVESEKTSKGSVVRLPAYADTNGDLYIVLDSLDTSGNVDRRFKSSFKSTVLGDTQEPLIKPGHDLYVSGTAQKKLNDTDKLLYLESDEVSVLTNSLFESVTSEEKQNDIVRVRCFRHLQNLDAASSYVPRAAPDGGTGLFEAKLAASLLWREGTAWKSASDVFVTPRFEAPENVSAISNSALLCFDGQGNTITGMPIGVNQNGKTTDHTAGLFGSFTARENSRIERLRLIDPSFTPDVTDQNASVAYAGLLLGSASGENGGEGKLTISDCGVFASVKAQKANPDTKAEMPPSVCYAGGLIGYINGGTVQDCFAAMPKLTLYGENTVAARYAGGLCGYAKNTDFVRSYANSGALTIKNASALDQMGGLIGYAQNGRITACYALGTLNMESAKKNARISGFAGAKDENTKINACYTAVSYGKELYEPEYVNPPQNGGESVNQGARVYAFSDVAVTSDGRYYLYTDGITEYYSYDAQGSARSYGAGKSYDEMSGEGFLKELRTVSEQWISAQSTNSHPYSTDTLSGAYPFPIITGGAAQNKTTAYPVEHYGDWPKRRGARYIVYYELYSTGAYGYYAEDLIDAAHNGSYKLSDTANLSWDGYAVLCESGEDAPVLCYSSKDGRRSAKLESGSIAGLLPPSTISLSIDGKTKSYAVYPFTGKAMEESIAQKQPAPAGVQTPKDSYYHCVSAGGYPCFINPNFAKAVVNGKDVMPAAAEEPETLLLRSARQLYRLSQDRQSAYWDRKLEQERKIDFAIYPYSQFADAPFASQPIGRKVEGVEIPFTGIYDGKENVINGLSLTDGTWEGYDSTYIGMFGLCSGTGRLWNIRLQNASLQGGSAYAGLLAGKLSAQSGEDGGNTPYMAKNCFVYAKDSVEVFGGAHTFDGKCELRSSAHAVGGFAGAAEGCNIYGCLTSPTLIEAQHGCTRSGGFAAELGETATAMTVERCYANIQLYKTFGTDAGGFADSIGSSVILKGDYALGRMAKAYEDGLTAEQKKKIDPTTAGFAITNKGSVSNCYSLFTYNQVGNETENLHPIKGYGFIKTKTDAGSLVSCYFMKTDGASSPDTDHGVEMSYADMMNLSKQNAGKLSNLYFSSVSGSTHPYKLTGGYPFPFLLSGALSASENSILPHYGDWPSSVGGTYLAYYEKYTSDGSISYGYYAGMLDTLDNSVSGHNGQKQIVEDGYAILSTETIASVKYGNGDTVLPMEAGVTYEADSMNYNGAVFSVYRFKADSPIMTMGDTEEDKLTKAEKCKIDPNGADDKENRYYGFYYQVKINDDTYYFNPDFAKTVSGTGQSLPAAVAVRTARQLEKLCNGRKDKLYWGYRCLKESDIGSPPKELASACTFVQEHDIELGSGYAVTPIGTDQSAFRCTYSGNGYKILSSFTISGNQHVGLFGYNKGTLTDILLVAKEGAAPAVSGNNYVGALCGTNAGEISNCLAAGFSVSGSGPIGGFVGQNLSPGAIENCAAIHYSVGGTGGGVSGGSSVGGFVGSCSGGSITGCFAVVTDTATSNEGEQKGFAGGNSASIYACYCAAYHNASGSYLDFGNGGNNCLAYQNGAASSAAYIAAQLSWTHADQEHSFPLSDSLSGECAWPSSVSDQTGKIIYYGNWIQ